MNSSILIEKSTRHVMFKIGQRQKLKLSCYNHRFSTVHIGFVRGVRVRLFAHAYTRDRTHAVNTMICCYLLVS